MQVVTSIASGCTDCVTLMCAGIKSCGDTGVDGDFVMVRLLETGRRVAGPAGVGQSVETMPDEGGRENGRSPAAADSQEKPDPFIKRCRDANRKSIARPGFSQTWCGSTFVLSAMAPTSSIKTQSPFRLDVLEGFRIPANVGGG